MTDQAKIDGARDADGGAAGGPAELGFEALDQVRGAGDNKPVPPKPKPTPTLGGVAGESIDDKHKGEIEL